MVGAGSEAATGCDRCVGTDIHDLVVFKVAVCTDVCAIANQDFSPSEECNIETNLSSFADGHSKHLV